MKFVTDNLLTLVLAIALVLSPMQSIAASVSECMDTNMHKQMTATDHVMDMSKSANASDCCNQSESECGTSHCAGMSVAVITQFNIGSASYSKASTHNKYKISLTSVDSSSLFRPPKFLSFS